MKPLSPTYSVKPLKHHIVNPNSEDLAYVDLRAIPGGRYGCAQFVKICGPNKLKQLSLGRISQMI